MNAQARTKIRMIDSEGCIFRMLLWLRNRRLEMLSSQLTTKVRTSLYFLCVNVMWGQKIP